jgi:hypothetical protein
MKNTENLYLLPIHSYTSSFNKHYCAHSFYKYCLASYYGQGTKNMTDDILPLWTFILVVGDNM